MENVVFGLHTAGMKKWITKKEAELVKIFFGLNPNDTLTANMYFYQQGITKIWIEEISAKSKLRYYIHVIVNFSRLLQTSNYCVMPYTTANIKRAITAVNKILKSLSLSNGNEKFGDWTVERFDSAFDVYAEHTELLMQLLNYSVILNDRKKRCSLIEVTGADPEKIAFQSMRFGNASYIYNIYVKMTELLNNGNTLTAEERKEVQNLLRLERQNFAGAVKKLLPNMTVADLASEKVREEVLKTMLDEVKLFFGEGDFYSWQRIKEKFYPDHQAEIEAVLDVMKLITNLSLMKITTVYTKEVAETFAGLGIAPAGIKGELARYSGVEEMQGIYHRLISQYPRPRDRRQYHSFPVPKRTKDGRLKAAITIYSVQNPRPPLSIAGRTREEYEKKVFGKLRETYLANRAYLKTGNAEIQEKIRKSEDSIVRFCKVTETKSVKTEVEEFIKTFQLK